jgi:hypothetical protein
MTAAATSPTRAVHPTRSPDRGAPTEWTDLQVEREDIAFTTLRPGVLGVEIAIRNPGPRHTAPTFGVLRSAPLGAFVPWQFLDVVPIPAVAPGESIVVRREYRYEAPRALGGPGKLPPDRVLTALGLGEPDRDPQPAAPALATDLLHLFQQGSPYWAGNLNLFFPGKDVERHVAQALRIYPGRVNLAMFVIGATADAYQFELTGDADTWEARLFDAALGRPILDGLGTPVLKEGTWHRPNCGLLLLTVRPPGDAVTGAVNVHVRQRSSGREAVVEFTMDSRAAGPGCYKL